MWAQQSRSDGVCIYNNSFLCEPGTVVIANSRVHCEGLVASRSMHEQHSLQCLFRFPASEQSSSKLSGI